MTTGLGVSMGISEKSKLSSPTSKKRVYVQYDG